MENEKIITTETDTTIAGTERAKSRCRGANFELEPFEAMKLFMILIRKTRTS